MKYHQLGPLSFARIFPTISSGLIVLYGERSRSSRRWLTLPQAYGSTIMPSNSMIFFMLPSAPFSLKTYPKFDEEHTNPAEVYQIAIHSFFSLSIQPWDDQVDLERLRIVAIGRTVDQTCFLPNRA